MPCRLATTSKMRMPMNKNDALAQIDAVVKRRKELVANWYPESVAEITTLTCLVIDRLTQPGSPFRQQKEKALQGAFEAGGRTKEEEIEFRLSGILNAL